MRSRERNFFFLVPQYVDQFFLLNTILKMLGEVEDCGLFGPKKKIKSKPNWFPFTLS